MAEPGLIPSYLTELRYSLSKLGDVDEILAEVEDHLDTTVEHLVARGMSTAGAEAQALARFGTPSLVARVHVEEARRGAAVSTRFTRRAGLAAMAAPPLMVGGIVVAGMGGGSKQPFSGIGVAMALTAVAALVLALAGLRKRHGGLGVLGRVAFWLAILAYPMALPFGWNGMIILAVQLGVVVMLYGVGMLRAGILPWPAVVMFAFTWPLWAPIAFVITELDDDAGKFSIFPIAVTLLGFMWLGRAMWREPALDARTARHEPMALA